MSEMTHALGAEVEMHPAARPWLSPSFPELVYAHHAWWCELRDGSHSRRAAQHYSTLREAFERRHGEIVRAHWCTNVESAVVMTEKPGRFPWTTPRPSFHRESDWVTQSCPAVATELHRCDELAVRATTVLTGVRRRICMNLVMASAEHLIGLADRHAGSSDEEVDASLLRQERAALARAEHYYTGAANGQAQIVYFVGMALVVMVLAAVSAVWLALAWAIPLAALLAGAIGAVVSVVARINNGKFDLEYDVGRPYALFLGGLRPLIGGAFAMALSFAFQGGLLHLPVSETESRADRRLALLVVSFVAGFSERWAQDTLVGAVPGGKKETTPAEPAPSHNSSATRPAG